jgi:chromosome segregation ATPase
LPNAKTKQENYASISQLEANTNDLHAQFEATLAHLEQEAEDKDAELRAANEEIEHLGKQVYALEEDADRISEEHERFREDETAEGEALEALASALKDVRPFTHLTCLQH